MKNKVSEAFFSFLAVFLFACGIAAIAFLGMLLVPVVILILFVVAIRGIIGWRKAARPVRTSKVAPAVQKGGAVISRMPQPVHTGNKAA